MQFSRAILNGHCTSQAVEDSHIFNSVFSQLELGENRIMSGLQSLQGSPKLAHLSLSNNRIKDLETLEPLVSTKFELSFVCESHPIQGRSTMLSDLRLKMKLLYFAVGWLVIFYYRLHIFLSHQSKLQNLKSLDLLNCEVTTIEDYRAEIFNMISSLKYLDGYDR